MGRAKHSGGEWDDQKKERPKMGTGIAEKGATTIEKQREKECARYRNAGLEPPAHCK